MPMSLVGRWTLSVALILVPSLAAAQRPPRQVEISVMGGMSHTDRVARLTGEGWVEPYAGARLDARLWQVAGGRAGVSVLYDHYSVGLSSRTSPPCLGICLASSRVPGADGLVTYRAHSTDARVALGASWQRPLMSRLHVDLGILAGARRVRSATRWDDFHSLEDTGLRGLVAGEAGLGTQWRALVAGVGVQFGSSVPWGGVRRSQNRVALRLGWALPSAAGR